MQNYPSRAGSREAAGVSAPLALSSSLLRLMKGSRSRSDLSYCPVVGGADELRLLRRLACILARFIEQKQQISIHVMMKVNIPKISPAITPRLRPPDSAEARTSSVTLPATRSALLAAQHTYVPESCSRAHDSVSWLVLSIVPLSRK